MLDELIEYVLSINPHKNLWGGYLEMSKVSFKDILLSTWILWMQVETLI